MLIRALCSCRPSFLLLPPPPPTPLSLPSLSLKRPPFPPPTSITPHRRRHHVSPSLTGCARRNWTLFIPESRLLNHAEVTLVQAPPSSPHDSPPATPETLSSLPSPPPTLNHASAHAPPYLCNGHSSKGGNLPSKHLALQIFSANEKVEWAGEKE